MLSLNIKDVKSKAIDFADLYEIKLKKNRDYIIQHGIKVNSKTLTPSGTHVKFLKKSLNDKVIRHLILSKPSEHKKIIDVLRKKLPSIQKDRSKIYQFIKYIFTTEGYIKMDKTLFYNELSIRTCIYCNRNYVLGIDIKKHVKGNLDHFYPKAKYPYLAMSFYNLIPCCESCNKIKSEYDTFKKKSIHPYERKNIKLFSMEINSANSFSYKLKKDDLLDMLAIKEIYKKGHSDILDDLYIKFFRENTSQHFKNLAKSLDLDFNKEEVYKLITSGFIKGKDLHKESFSKMKKDIVYTEFRKQYKKD